MKLNINFQIKDGKRIISRDTKGYKVLLNRVTREFEKIQHLPSKQTEVTIIIQMSQQSAYNNSGLNYRICGRCDTIKQVITMYYHNCDSEVKLLLPWLAHELGHFYHFKNDNYDWCISSTDSKECYADSFAERFTSVNPKSITGKVRSLAAMNRSR